MPHPTASHDGDLRELLTHAETLFQQGDTLGALQEAQRAARITDDLRVRLMTAKYYFAMHRYAEAEKAYQRALDMDPASEPAARGLRLSRDRQ